jgi:hypothetical protein
MEPKNGRRAQYLFLLVVEVDVAFQRCIVAEAKMTFGGSGDV